ncbi:MAG: trypsin-like peptidase domain-containing protein [Steroidobacteraceae bacterium]
MNPGRLGRSAIFLAGAVAGGLALAFIVVFFEPELLIRTPLKPAAHAAPAPAAELDLPREPAAAGAAGGEPAPLASVQPLHSFAAAVHRAAPAVVNIYTKRVVTERVQASPMDQFFGDFWPRMRQRVQGALGSGVIVDELGHIVTNNHVIANATTINVQLADGRIAQARVVGRDPDTDLALLVIKLGQLPVMTLGRSDRLQVGDEVLAIGNPLGLQQTVTHGIVSATGRSQLNIATFENFIQTDAAINEGNSGGALVNADGELVGINTAVIAKNMDATGVEGIGFAIPVNLVRGVMRDILDHGRVVRGWTGLVPEDFSAEQAAQNGLARGGVVITNLYQDSPALAAGVRVGDILLAVDGHETLTAQDALKQLATQKPGDKVKLRVLRGQTGIEIECRVIERPSQV